VYTIRMHEIIWFVFGALFGAIIADFGKDVYKFLKVKYYQIRRPYYEVKERDGFIHRYRKSPRFWHYRDKSALSKSPRK